MQSLSIVLLALAANIVAISAYAQISSSAFDPNCYQPRLGVDIDTIMGSYNGQMLGAGLINIGPSPDNPSGPGSLMMYGLPGTLGDSSAALLNVGPNFNSRNLDITKMLGFKPRSPIFGHFRSGRSTDLLLLPADNPFWLPRIYWQKPSGEFDSSYYTTLLPDERLRRGFAGYFNELDPPYHSKLESDTVDDLLLFYTYYPEVMSSIFKGGASLFRPGDTVLADKSLFFDSLKNFQSLLTTQGDFSGNGRNSLVVMDRYSNLLCYPTDSAFSLERFTRLIKNDTLFASEVDPWTRRGALQPCTGGVRMRNNAPESLVLFIDSAFLEPSETRELRFLTGGADFGSRRISLDTLPIIHEPKFFDGGNFRLSGWGASVTDCGDMTGNGDHVLYVEGEFGHDLMFHTFYVLGNSFDEKVDMYMQEDDGGTVLVDTATLDGDRLQDVVVGAGNFPWLTVNGKNANGTLLFIHGTTKIPVHTNAVKRANEAAQSISVTEASDRRSLRVELPSGADGACTATLYDFLGRGVAFASFASGSEITIPIPRLPSGFYVMSVRAGEKSWSAKVVM